MRRLRDVLDKNTPHGCTRHAYLGLRRGRRKLHATRGAWDQEEVLLCGRVDVSVNDDHAGPLQPLPLIVRLQSGAQQAHPCEVELYLPISHETDPYFMRLNHTQPGQQVTRCFAMQAWV